MFIVTGAAGFIGSNIIKGLNAAGHSDILAVGDLTDGKKYRNLSAVNIADYMDMHDFLEALKNDTLNLGNIKAIFHQGACSVTTEWDGRYMMKNNYDYSKVVFHYCVDKAIPFLYASSAAVYGANTDFDDHATEQAPLNVYGYSKWLFDQYVLRHLPNVKSQVVGFRYFNVFGPHEQHKGSMASVAFHLMNQLQEGDDIKLFQGCDGYADGEQQRDFVFVDDVVKVNLWFMENSGKSGIYNLGTGKARSFNDVANGIIMAFKRGKIKYIPFPDHLKGAYQSFTQANIKKLRAAGYEESFTPLEDAIAKYVVWYTRPG